MMISESQTNDLEPDFEPTATPERPADLNSTVDLPVIHKHRETWLSLFGCECENYIYQQTGLRCGQWTISCGFPKGGRKSIGQCWSAKASEGNRCEIFIHPILSTAEEVMHVVAHELLHAALPGQGHNRQFLAAANQIGLKGPARCTTAGPAFSEWTGRILPIIGEYPHERLNSLGATTTKQSTRLLKAKCRQCGYIVRVTSLWIKNVGAPHCPHHGEMSVV
jgi:hypothetical protein